MHNDPKNTVIDVVFVVYRVGYIPRSIVVPGYFQQPRLIANFIYCTIIR